MTAAITAASPPPAPLDLAASAVFLDLDGTLAPLCGSPHEVALDARVIGILRRLQAALSGRLAIVSGRSLSALDAILCGCVDAGAGLHGLERRGRFGLERAVPHAGLAAARERLAALAAETPGVLIEEKGAAIAIHYRRAPSAEHRCAAVAATIARDTGLAVQAGAMVVELKTPGADKGSAVRAFMAEPPFAGTAPVFIGDDLTDEDGFAAAEALGGFGVLVGPPRLSRARRRLDDPEAVLDWLQRSLG